jgi:bifunctional UDP-N-acetylglucosamine pyrophosphorylase/glucosamine-1-phosphate N-acetyltransferase
MAALPHIKNRDQPILVLYADTPFINKDIMCELLDNIKSGSDICVLGFNAENPSGYGRLVTSSTGSLDAIIEDSEASASQKMITNVNAGIMAFNGSIIEETIQKITPSNSKQEYFLTDIVSVGSKNNLSVDYILTDKEHVIGINNLAQLAIAESVAQNNLRRKAMLSGVTMIAPETVFLQKDTIFGQDVIIEPNVVIAGGVSIASNCHIKSFCHLEKCSIGEGNIIGPFARIRPDTITSQNVKIGNFVEVKKSTLGDGAKVNHLSYIGDTQIGDNANIGAGTITCNYDGYRKYKTKIGNGAFIGSNTALVAPVTIGDNAIIGAGSTITQDVPNDGLSLSRSKQTIIPSGAEKVRNKRT